MEEIYTALIAGAVALISAGVSFIVSYINNKKTQTELAELKSIVTNNDSYYVVCDSCGNHIKLTSTNIQTED